MKEVVLILTLLSSILLANELKTIYSYENALQKAKDANKSVMIMMSYDGCPVCDHMKDIVFEKEAVLEYMNENYFVVIKDLVKDKYPQRFASLKSPTFFFIDPNTKEELIKREVGGFMPKKFLNILKKARGDTQEIEHIASNENETNTTQTTEQNLTIKPCEKTVPCEKTQKVISL